MKLNGRRKSSNVEDVRGMSNGAKAGIGGIGGIIIGVVKFSANQIAERMSKKFEASLNKELEKYKTELSKKKKRKLIFYTNLKIIY